MNTKTTIPIRKNTNQSKESVNNVGCQGSDDEIAAPGIYKYPPSREMMQSRVPNILEVTFQDKMGEDQKNNS